MWGVGGRAVRGTDERKEILDYISTGGRRGISVGVGGIKILLVYCCVIPHCAALSLLLQPSGVFFPLYLVLFGTVIVNIASSEN